MSKSQVRGMRHSGAADMISTGNTLAKTYYAHFVCKGEISSFTVTDNESFSE